MNIMLIDDHKMFLDGMRLMLEIRLNHTVVGEFTSVFDALAALPSLNPTLVITDISMPGMTGLEAIPQIRQVLPDVYIIVLSQHSDTGTVTSAIKAGANAFVLKSKAFDFFEDAIKSVQSGLLYLSPELNDKLLTAYIKGSGEAKTGSTIDLLSSREYEVFMMLVKNIPIKAIAKDLGMSRNTVSVHRRHICQKLNVQTDQELLKIAIQEGLVEIH